MFEKLHDPDPPAGDARQLAAVAERARRMRHRRSAGIGALAIGATFAAGAALVTYSGRGGDDVLVSATDPGARAAPDTAAGAPAPAPTTTPDGSAPATVAPATEAPAPSTSQPPASVVATTIDPAAVADDGVVAVGDFVMLGAAEDLSRFAAVDASAARPPELAIETVGAVGPDFSGTIVVHVGNDGPLPPDFSQRLLAAAPPRARLIVVTIPGSTETVNANNEILRELADDVPGVLLLDWASLSAGCGAGCFDADGLGLRDGGRAYYAGVVERAVRPVFPTAGLTPIYECADGPRCAVNFGTLEDGTLFILEPRSGLVTVLGDRPGTFVLEPPPDGQLTYLLAVGPGDIGYVIWAPRLQDDPVERLAAYELTGPNAGRLITVYDEILDGSGDTDLAEAPDGLVPVGCCGQDPRRPAESPDVVLGFVDATGAPTTAGSPELWVEVASSPERPDDGAVVVRRTAAGEQRWTVPDIGSLRGMPVLTALDDGGVWFAGSDAAVGTTVYARLHPDGRVERYPIPIGGVTHVSPSGDVVVWDGDGAYYRIEP